MLAEEDENRKFKLLADCIKIVVIISQRRLILRSPKEHFIHQMLTFLLQFPKMTSSHIHQSLSLIEYYNYDYVEALLGEICERVKFNPS